MSPSLDVATNGIRPIERVNRGLSSPTDQEHQFPVNYSYDYLNGGIRYLRLPTLKLNDQLQNLEFLRTRDQDGKKTRSEHAINIFPSQAGLPRATAIMSCRQNKYWQITVDTTRVFLSLFAADESSQQIFKSQQSIADISRRALAKNMEEGWLRFSVYLYAESDRQRTRLLAAVQVFIFIFDDFWEMHDVGYFSEVQRLFLDRMHPGFQSNSKAKTPLQFLIDSTIDEIRSLDHETGTNAGQEMINLMLRFFARPPPPKQFRNMEEFLLYRHEDAATPFVLSCAKFALNSSVDLDNPRLERFVRLCKDHIAVANDLGSWAKEKQAYDTGKVIYMINAVDVVKSLFRLPGDEAAVAMTQAFQLQIEIDIDDEVQRLRAEDSLTAEDWEFIDAALHVLSGNVFVSTVMSRYGGEGFRLY